MSKQYWYFFDIISKLLLTSTHQSKIYLIYNNVNAWFEHQDMTWQGFELRSSAWWIHHANHYSMRDRWHRECPGTTHSQYSHPACTLISGTRFGWAGPCRAKGYEWSHCISLMRNRILSYEGVWGVSQGTKHLNRGRIRINGISKAVSSVQSF